MTEPPVRVVAVGASAGGLEAISDLFRELTADVDMAFVVVMHLDPQRSSSLAPLLGKVCRLPVAEATDGTELERGHVYVIPPNTILTVRDQRLRLGPREDSGQPPKPIDALLRSLAEQHDGQGIGVILSGTGSDGTSGLQALAVEGGITFAQDRSAAYDDMPRSAIASGCVDRVLPPREIAAELIKISNHPSGWLYDNLANAQSAPTAHDTNEADAAVLNGLVRRLSRFAGIDFIEYKQASIRRRILRRILLLGLKDVDDYVAYLDQHPDEAEQLCNDILIRVTSFFRDPEVFEALETTILPAITEDRSPGVPIRVWVPGCASGEEAYSIAICLLEFFDSDPDPPPIKIFGTDVADSAVNAARSGRYTDGIEAAVSPERLRRFFVRGDNGYVVAKAVRDLCVFARQDVTRDPPFSDLDLISCRNLLIYLGPTLQKRVIPLFHYALKDGGHLLLGTSEGVGAAEDRFTPVEGCQGFYRRRTVPRRLPPHIGGHLPRSHGGGEPNLAAHSTGSVDVQREADRLLLTRYAPAGVLVDDGLEILHFRGDTGAFLAPAPGAPSNNLLRMAREGLLPDLRSLIDEGQRTGAPAHRTGVRTKVSGREVVVELELLPIRVPGSEARCFAILFKESPPDGDAATRHAAERMTPAEEESRVQQLERELTANRDFLRANIERLEITNEELRAANEEILSSNEELQSTNEELQTTKEELQATNEELLTTNEELRHRNREVATLNDDLNNVLVSVKLPIVIVGRDLKVRRFTPAAGRIFALDSTDIGHSLLEADSGIDPQLIQDLVDEVLDTLVPAEREVQSSDGRWHSMRVCPFRASDDRLDGAVVVLGDIDRLKRLTQTLERSRDFSSSILQSIREPLLVLGMDNSIRMANLAFHEAFTTEPESVLNRRLGVEITGELTPKLLEMLATVRDAGEVLENIAIEADVPDRGTRRFRLDARPVPGDGDQESLMLLTIEDVTEVELQRSESRRFAEKLQEAQRLESLGVLAGGIAHDFNNILTAILGFAELIRMSLPADSGVSEQAAQIVRCAENAADLCSEMLAYSGRGRFQVEPIDLSELITRSNSLLEAMVGKQTTLHLELGADLPLVDADVSQLRQVIANLVINAAESFGDKGGNVTLKTGVLETDEAFLERCRVGDVPPGEYVYLEVTDDGPGMSPETQERIFDPFFTTKFTGRGLGLAAVLGIVRGHRGALTIDSEVGRGSTFCLLLPVRPNPSESAPAQSGGEPADWTGSGTVLVIDDEPDVRSLLDAALPSLGFVADLAPDGAAGIEKVRSSDEPYALVLLDLTMPGLSGAETFHSLRELRPDQKIVMMSGYDEAEVLSGFRSSDVNGFLRKPFLLADLSAVIRRAFAADSETAPDA